MSKAKKKILNLKWVFVIFSYISITMFLYELSKRNVSRSQLSKKYANYSNFHIENTMHNIFTMFNVYIAYNTTVLFSQNQKKTLSLKYLGMISEF